MKRNLTDAFLAKLTSPPDRRLEIFDVQVPGFGVRIGTSGKRTFFALYRTHGKQVRQTLGTYPAMTLKDARSAAARCIALAGAGLDPERLEHAAPGRACHQSGPRIDHCLDAPRSNRAAR